MKTSGAASVDDTLQDVQPVDATTALKASQGPIGQTAQEQETNIKQETASGAESGAEALDQHDAFPSGCALEADASLKERTPIVWTGRPKEAVTAAAPAASTSKVADDAGSEQPQQRLKPNAAFLLNVVADAERGNKRKRAEDATNVALSVVGQVHKILDS